MATSNMREKLTTSLREGANPILRIIGDSLQYDRLFFLTYSFYNDKTLFQKDLSKLIKLSLEYDYRFIAIYLWALKNQKQDLLKIFEVILQPRNGLNNEGKHIFELALQRFKEVNAKEVDKLNILFTKSLNQTLSFNKVVTAIYLYNRKYKKVLTNFVSELKGSLSDFIDIQLDIPNRNAAIRQGDVKQWNLPDGTDVVSKRMKPGKVEKFIKEQKNFFRLMKMVPDLTFEINSSVENGKIHVSIATPFALVKDNYAGNVYALYKRSAGTPLEEILYSTKNKSERRKYLSHFKLIMEELFARGIWWGDMSPRNILVDEASGESDYALIDFEKTKIFNNPISEKKKVEHWRGQVFIEELCVICPIEEILEVFRDYFDPGEWNVNSKRRIPFSLRPDIKSLLAGRGIKNLKIGEYNSLDKKILSVRKPRVTPKSHVLYYPGTIGFKVEHYLSSIGDDTASDYDRKTTEVLLAAREHEVFDKIAQMLLHKAKELEIKLVELEFSALLKDGLPNLLYFPEEEISLLKSTLDTLYENRKNRFFYQKFGKEEL